MKKIFSIFLLLIAYTFLYSQNKKPLFWNEIQEFKKLNKQKPPSEGSILLLGSSSFTNWKDVSNYFPEKQIINRGFGGSRLTDLNHYSEDLLNPYQPKQIIIYCGENDLADNAKLKVDVVVDRFKEFYTKIRRRFPAIQVDYISIKYSPSREHLWPKMKLVNKKIAKFLKKQNNSKFIDITPIMNDKKGNIRKDLYLEDMLHITPEGYKLWTSVMNPYMK